MSLHPEPFVILGMPRSGTSAAAGALAKLGVYLGSDSGFYPADENNPGGYYELRDLISLNHQLLANFQMDLASIRGLPRSWPRHPLAGASIERLAGYLKTTFENRGLWAFKQPMTTLLLPIYQAAFRSLGLSPRFLLCVRNPLEVMASEADWSFEQNARLLAPLGPRALGVWLRYTAGPFASIDPAATTVIVYEKLIEDAKSALKGIAERLGGGEELLQAAASSVHRDARHGNASSVLADWPDLIRSTYRLCQDLAEDPHGFAAGVFAERISGVEGEFQTWVDMFSEPKPSAGILGLAYSRDGRTRAFETRYLPAGDWQTLRLRVDAPPKTPLAGSLYNLPCRVWIRKAVWTSDASTAPAILSTGPCSILREVAGMTCLEGVFESRQLILETPRSPGPYELELEIFLETGKAISESAAQRLTDRLEGLQGR